MYFRGEPSKEPVPSIAIVGAALRFPGAADPASFHELTVSGRRMFRNVRPPGRLVRAALLGSPRPGACLPGRDSSQEDTHPLAVETAAAALADVPASRPRTASRVGAIIAAQSEPAGPDVTSWVCERLGLARPDWAPRYSCSLRAIAAACELLRTGQLDLVLAGGVTEGIDPVWLAYRAHAGALADDDVRVYDVSPTGMLPGEGCGVVALMPAREARAAGIGVYAEIASWHAADGITAPSSAIRDAYLRSGIDPADVQYVEGHGAATAMDDLAELTALLDVLAPRHDGTPGGCALGSVTANIGDTRGAAGVAALLKTALAMAEGIVPPTTGCVQPHQLLRAGAAPFRLPSSPGPWPEVTTRLAAVNTLGAADLAVSARSGPVHLVLRRDGKPARRPGASRRFPGAAPPANARVRGARGRPPGEPGREPVPPGDDLVITVRGTDRDDLAVTLDTIAITAARLPAAALREFALEMAAVPASGGLRARAALVARDPAQLAERARKAAGVLRERPAGRGATGTRPAGTGCYVSEEAAGRVALLFPGLVSTGAEHAAVLSASMATLGTAERLGLRPRLAVGYSFGEIAGLAWAGVLTFGEAARLAAHRAEIIRATPGRAAMARVYAGPGMAAELCSGTSLTVAGHEGPVQHVLAGPVCDIRELPRRAAERGVDTEVLNLTHALHSPAMRPSAAPMRAVVDGLRFAEPRRRLISTVTGLDITGSADPAGLVADQLTRPALLAGALALACADADLVLLTARDPALARMAGGCVRVPVVQAPLDQRPGTVLPSALAAFFAARAIDNVLSFLPGGSSGPAADTPGPGQAAGEPAARATDGSQSGRSGMPDLPSECSLTPRI